MIYMHRIKSTAVAGNYMYSSTDPRVESDYKHQQQSVTKNIPGVDWESVPVVY